MSTARGAPRSMWILAAVLAALLAVPAAGSLYVTYLATEILIFALFALAFNLLLGYGGLISFGHAAYFAIGAYGCAVLSVKLSWPLAAAFPAGVALATVAAAIIGYFCVKLTEIYLAILTLAFGQLVWAVAFKWSAVTGGDTGLIGVPVPAWLDEPAQFYYFALAIVGACVALLWVVVHSAFGRTLAATRENAVRAEFVGIHVKRVQLVAFVISGGISGIAGALHSIFNRSVFVESAWWTQSAEVLIMAVLGGIHSFAGPAVGAAALILLERLIRDVTEYWPTFLGAILLVVLFVFPTGLAGMARRRAARSVERA
ncbi:MAG: branched-chain amino acid ABC transporter permease [Burkholderiales bacterium]